MHGMAPRRFVVVVAVAACVGAVACSLFVDTDGLSNGDAGAALATTDAAVDGAATTDGSSTNPEGGDASTKTCPSGIGPDMVMVPGNGSTPGFCVDSTEVTSTQYSAFLGSNPPLSLLPAVCSYKASFRTISTSGNLPANVDWCDAAGFCAYSGKRLCGKIGGGSNDYESYSDVTASQWYYACTAGGRTIYPYGNSFDGTICNDSAFDAGAPIPVKTAAKCIGGFPGLYDMAGNMWEWEDSCIPGDSGSPADDQCRARGGCWVDGVATTRCDYDYIQHFDPRRDSTSYMGFRCCAD
jgi:sulfatase modifying factor 1